jgi:hypothetical protein
VSLTNAYRHLFYPTKDEVKAPTGLMHYVLPAQDSSAIKGNSNQQSIILKALKDCEKIRLEGSKPFAPVYIKTDVGAVREPPLPESIEFSDRFILYRRGILQPPEPRVIELNAQVMPSTETEKPVRVRWKAKGALKTNLYQKGVAQRIDDQRPK